MVYYSVEFGLITYHLTTTEESNEVANVLETERLLDDKEVEFINGSALSLLLRLM